MNLSAATLQRKREKKRSRRMYYAKNRTRFLQTFGPYLGEEMYRDWRRRGGWAKMRKGRTRAMIKGVVEKLKHILK